jgi:hypothetical protein
VNHAYHRWRVNIWMERRFHHYAWACGMGAEARGAANSNLMCQTSTGERKQRNVATSYRWSATWAVAASSTSPPGWNATDLIGCVSVHLRAARVAERAMSKKHIVLSCNEPALDEADMGMVKQPGLIKRALQSGWCTVGATVVGIGVLDRGPEAQP